MTTEVRRLLTDVSVLEDAVAAIERSKKIMVITGAGVSVSCGIPDFRSKDSGLYNTLDCQSIGIPSAELLFDLEYFKIDPAPFYKFCKCLLPKNVVPSASHRFISLLESMKKLQRNYTQNVDGIERIAGVTKVIECHGTMNEFQCLSEMCYKKRTPLSEVIEDIKNSEIAYCVCGEALKPSITFFGELLPANFHKACDKDVLACDLVLVMGTSLKVGGSVHQLLKRVRPGVPQILMNRDAVAPPKSFSDGFDVSLLGKCDDIVQHLCERLGWDLNTVVVNTSAILGGVDTSGLNDEILESDGHVPTIRSSISSSTMNTTKAPTLKKRKRTNFDTLCLDPVLRTYSIVPAVNPVNRAGKKRGRPRKKASKQDESNSYKKEYTVRNRKKGDEEEVEEVEEEETVSEPKIVEKILVLLDEEVVVSVHPAVEAEEVAVVLLVLESILTQVVVMNGDVLCEVVQVVNDTVQQVVDSIQGVGNNVQIDKDVQLVVVNDVFGDVQGGDC